MKHFAIIALFSITFVIAYAQSPQDEYTKGEIQWEEAMFVLKNGTGFAKIIVTDPDMNKFSGVIDTLKVFAFSDTTWEEKISLTLYETEKNSGIFERTFTLSETRFAPNILQASSGDTIGAIYTDTTLPSTSTSKSIDLSATAIVDTAPRFFATAFASPVRIEDLNGGMLITPIIPVDKQIKVVSDLQSHNERTQNFIYIVQIQDEQGYTVSLSWIDGILSPLQTITSSQSWIPQQPGQYEVVIFVWESIDNPTALSPPRTATVTVKDPQYEQYVEASIIGLNYNQILKQSLPNFAIKFEGQGSNYERIPSLVIKTDGDDNASVTVWTNEDYSSIPFDRQPPGSFCKEYRFNDIGGPVMLNQTGIYHLVATFKEMIYSQEFLVNSQMVRDTQVISSTEDNYCT